MHASIFAYTPKHMLMGRKIVRIHITSNTLGGKKTNKIKVEN